MWGTVENKSEYLKHAIWFTGDHELYGMYMKRVVLSWRYSCEHNLSNVTQNRKAWLGHAACALAFECPESIVRKAWSFLSEEQQALANNQADKCIKLWESMQCQSENQE